MRKRNAAWTRALAPVVAPVLLLALLLAVHAPAGATNGMYLAGYGSEAAGRGGTNIAIADRALGLQSNPAGIAQLQGNHLSVDLQLLMPKLRYYGDPFGNDIDAESKVFPMPSLSYVRGGHETRWTWGVGLISQGGMGAEFQGYNTPFGTVDQTMSEVRFLTLTPTVAYSATPDLSFGLSLNGGYSDVTFRFWPQTSFYTDSGTPTDPTDDVGFFGPDMVDRAHAWTSSVRLGAMWRATPRIQLGAIYQNATSSDYTGGTLRLDQTAIGLGAVNYDGKVTGFNWPDQFGFGVQLRPADRWIIAVDAKDYLWSNSIKTIEVQGSNPDNASTPVTNPTLPFVFDWKDQWVIAAGAEFRASPAVTLRGGYNHGPSPVPDTTLNPLFPAITEDHATAGLGYTWGGNTLNFAVERAFNATQTNPNTDPNVNPFGPGATVDHSQWTISLGFSKAFSR
jgi:long-chain fatty acid transport protein